MTEGLKHNDLSSTESAMLGVALTQPDGTVKGPTCCGQPMQDDGGCSEGCCDDYKCGICGKRIRIEWPD